MSMVICDSCERLVDSDDDPDCFIEPDRSIPPGLIPTQVYCEPCREREWERWQEHVSEETP